MANAAVGEGCGGLGKKIVAKDDVAPVVLVERMKEIKVDVGGLKFPELFVEESVEIRRRFDEPDGELGSQLDLFSVAVLERPADDELALAFVVGISRVKIVDAAVDGVTEHADCFR